ncbi:MAG: hypothetical protein JW969_03110 [Spirochaetales bacterium]|nr:hypothetical protein [Spirochaetales bacterium]
MQDMFGQPGNRRNYNNRGNNPFGSLLSGLLFLGIFGFFAFSMRSWMFVLPVLILAVFPMIDGIKKLVNRKKIRAELNQTEGASNEKVILTVAKGNHGIVTPTLVALHSDISIDQADKLLQDMAKKGYAEMKVRDSGKIVYEFSDFLPEKTNEDF